MSRTELIGYGDPVNPTFKLRAKRRLGRLAARILSKTGSADPSEVGVNEAVNVDLSAIFIAVP